MNTLESMRQKLLPLGLYSLDGTTIVDAELAAYAAGLDMIAQNLDTLEKECYIQTAGDFGISLKEKLSGLEKSAASLESRRDMLLSRNAVTPNDYNRQSMERALIAVGIRASITERIPEQTVYINCIELLTNFISREQTINAAQEFLPAHLLYDFDFRNLTWNFIDEQNDDFDSLEQTNYTWNKIDTYGVS